MVVNSVTVCVRVSIRTVIRKTKCRRVGIVKLCVRRAMETFSTDLKNKTSMLSNVIQLKS